MKQYLDYIKKTSSWLYKLSKDEDLSLLWVYWDYTWSVIRHRCLIRQYVIGEFWKKSNAERKRCLTYNRIVKLFKKLNQKDYIHILNNKPEFNAFFKDFVQVRKRRNAYQIGYFIKRIICVFQVVRYIIQSYIFYMLR